MRVNLDLQTICTPRKYVRGIAYYTLEVVKNLLTRGNNDYIATFFDYQMERGNRAIIGELLGKSISEFKGIYENNSISYPEILKSMESNDMSVYGNMSYEDLFGSKADIIHFFHLTRMPHNLNGHPAVVTIHDIMPVMEELKNTFADGTYEQFVNGLRYIRENRNIKVIAVSEATKADVVRYGDIAPERITVIDEAANEDLYYHDEDRSRIEKYHIPRDYILYLGALDPRKGIDTLMEAEKYLNNRDIPIVLTGQPSDKYDLPQEMKKAVNPDRFIFTGYVTDDEKRVLLSNAKAFIFPSRYEGFGLPVLEAMACGTPVITTNVSSLPEVGGDAVLYIEPDEAEGLADTIDRLLDDSKLQAEYVKKGLERAKQFSWDKTAELTEQIYTKFI